jgi:protein disulfide-isomerase
MWRIIAALCLMFSAALLTGKAEGATTASKLNWMTNFDDASTIAKKDKKPLFLFFTGSDWCGWCHKLENEALSTNEFYDAAGDKFIFVMVDFPLKSPLDAKTTAQNKELQRKYGVQGFPTIILLDDNLQKIGQTGYQAGGGRAYAEQLKKMVESFKGYKQKLSKLNSSNMDSSELQTLYGKASELCRPEDTLRIIKVGMQNKDNHFFLLERFRFLAHEGQIHTSETQAIRQQLLQKDKNNALKTHYNIAVIEFEAYAHEMEKENYAPEIALAPLVAYIERFGDNDQENTWRLQMIIAQVYLDNDRLTDAIRYAKAAHALAPESSQLDIQTFIHNIQKDAALNASL